MKSRLHIVYYTIILVVSIINVVSAETVLRPDFQNNLITPPGVNSDKTNSASLFGGGIFDETSDLKPGTSDKSICLPQFAFGQMLSNNIPYVNFVDSSLNEALDLLYDDSDNKPAAFRYKKYLYAKGEGEEYIRARFENFSEYWGDTERERAFQAAEKIKVALKYKPLNQELRWQLLDVYYNMAVADMQLGKQMMITSILASIGYIDGKFITMPDGEFTISHEIAYLEAALKLYENAAVGYYELFNSPLGFDVSDIDSGSTGMPFGHYIFKEEVPNRSLESPLVVDTENNNELVAPLNVDPENPNRYKPYEVFNGYKDLVILFDIQKEYLRCATELTRKYIFRDAAANGDEKSDKDKALELIGKMEQKSYMEGNILLSICPDYKNASVNSGLADSISAWRNGITQIASLRDYVGGTVNLIGFTDDFLTLVQSVIPGDNGSQYFNSYDFFENYLVAAYGPLSTAKSDLEKAKSDYGTYRDRQDQLATQFREKKETYEVRLFQIMGARPNETAYETPLQNVGCELYQQNLNLELAKKRIEKNSQEIENLIKEIQIEIDRRAGEKGINHAINSVYLKYGTKQALLTREIGLIQATQAAANAAAQAASSGIKGMISHGVNAAAQFAFELMKGDLNAKKEKLAAKQNVEINSLNDSLLDVNSKARIKTLLLRMSILCIDSQEAQIELAVQQGRMHALYKEKIDIERRIAESNENLAQRFFADPSHRLIMDSSVLRTKYSFKNAQKWLYFTVKALEYKWNKKFTHTDHGRTYNSDTLLALRNADELMDMYTAMKDWNSLISLSGRNDDAYKKFSLCEDFLGYRYGDLYPDPVNGQLVSSTQAFRSYLSMPENYIAADDPKNPIPGYKVLKLKFSTAYEPSSGNFFMRNRWLEKIKYLRVKALGGANYDLMDSIIPGYLKYAGVSYIRNQTPGTVDPERPDKLINEMTSYPTNYWWWDDSNGWQMNDGLGASINVEVSTDPDVPQSVTQVDLFKEYSVAASGWELYLPVESSDGIQLLNIARLQDLEIHFYFYYYTRNNN